MHFATLNAKSETMNRDSPRKQYIVKSYMGYADKHINEKQTFHFINEAPHMLIG